jgi:hypothetical protein
MNTATSSIHELCDRVEAGDPEATRRFQNQITPLIELHLRRSQAVPTGGAAPAAASFVADGDAPRATPDTPRSDSTAAQNARRICRAIVEKLQTRRRRARHDTVGGRSAWFTTRLW